jgi:hypothetical protein
MSTVKLNHFTQVSFAFLIFLLGCGGGDETTKQEKVTKLLTQGGGKWQPAATANSITLGGIDVEDELFPNFEITFSKTQISTLGTSPVWPVSDTWTFKDKNADVIIRGSDDREISIISINSSQLVIQMEWDQTTYGGRTSSLPGLYEFVLIK